jgi:5-methylcytosine-specific restriction enzyme A
MPTRLCLAAKCPNPATAKGRCDFHRKLQERERSRVRRQEGRERNRFYARKHWETVRRRKLFEQPLCELCDVALATEVHHRIALEDGGEEYAPENLVSTCKPCHSRETLRERRVSGDGPAAA